MPEFMTRTFFIVLIIFSSTFSMSQTMTFSQRANQLFFGVNFSGKSSSLINSFLSVPQLHYNKGVRQWNLNVSMEMKSENKANAQSSSIERLVLHYL
jgi:hypothetical protein